MISFANVLCRGGNTGHIFFRPQKSTSITACKQQLVCVGECSTGHFWLSESIFLMLFFCQKKSLFSQRCLQHFLVADGFLQLILFKKSGYFSPKMGLKSSLWAVIMLRGAPYKVAYHWQPVGGKEVKTVWLSRSLLSDELKNLSILLSTLQNDECLLDLAPFSLVFSFPGVFWDMEGSHWHLSVQMSVKKTFLF